MFLPKRRVSIHQTAALIPQRAVCVLRRHKGVVCVNWESTASFQNVFRKGDFHDQLGPIQLSRTSEFNFNAKRPFGS